MGIGLNAVHLMAQSLPLLGDLSHKKLLTLGVQDCHFTHDQAVGFLQKHKIGHVAIPPHEVMLTTGFRWATADQRRAYRACIHQRSFFRLMGWRAENILSLDYSDFEGADITHDLNVPVDATLHSQFDLIFDGGTTEHVFSPKDSLANITKMCKVGGLIINFLPVDYINHGLYNFSAEVLHDFYAANGFEQLHLEYIAVPTDSQLSTEHYLAFDPTKYTHSLAPFYQTLVFSVVRKLKEVELEAPSQGYYGELWQVSSSTDKESARPAPQSIFRALKRSAVGIMNRSFFLSVNIRGYRNIMRGRRVSI